MGFKKEIMHLPNFVEIEKFREFTSRGKDRSSGGVRTFVFFGRLAREKGLRTLLQAIKILNKKVESHSFLLKIIGDGSMRESLIEEVKSDKIFNVRFLGYMAGDDLLKELVHSTATILPSECYENNPMSVIESFALGIPVIGARIGGIVELVRDNETGITFIPGDAQDLSLKIEYFLQHPDFIEEMGKSARQFVESELSAERYYKNLLEIYKLVIAKKRGRKKLT